ncbi:hypothetical protein DL93DRAFT_2072348 [Clavulina sp. PMI_390]|nr:hypothetical protein DL93DRAFT_2072348 [Clavulina sp. PMI_390]
MDGAYNMERRWWTTSNGSVFLPTFSTTTTTTTLASGSVDPTSGNSGISASTTPQGTQTGGGGGSDPSGSSTSGLTPSTTSSVAIPLSYTVVSTESSVFTTIVSTSPGAAQTITSTAVWTSTVPTQTTSWSIINIGGGVSQPTGVGNASNNARSICAGQGVDSMSIGVFATLIFGLVVGAAIWLLFAFLRPRVRQLYGLREWFIRPELRPPPLGSGLLAFLHPPVPLVPAVPKDVSEFGDSTARDAQLFPSDDELTQRTIWVAVMLTATYSIIGLAGALPLYMVNTPCIGNTAPDATYSGQWSALQDLSLLRLLQLLKEGNINTAPGSNNQSPIMERSLDFVDSSAGNLYRRLIVDGKDYAPTARTRLIILTVLTIVVGVLPAFHRLIKEFNRLHAFHKRWVQVRCDGMEMGWLSITRAPGLKGMGEGEVKALLERSGMTRRATAGGGGGGALSPPPSPPRRGSSRDSENGSLTGRRTSRADEGGDEIDVTGVFSIVDTHKLKKLIGARDVVLNNLEKSECLYIDSFRLSSPAPSEAGDFGGPIAEEPEEPEEPEVTAPDGRHISRPGPLRGSRAQASMAPTSYMAPSSYYRLRNPRGVSGGTSRGHGAYADDQSLSDEFGARVVGSRFHEHTTDSGQISSPHSGMPLIMSATSPDYRPGPADAEGSGAAARGVPGRSGEAAEEYWYNPNTYSANYPSRHPSITFGRTPGGNRQLRTTEKAPGSSGLGPVPPSMMNLGAGPNHGEPDAAEEMSGLDEQDIDNWAIVARGQDEYVPEILERTSFLARLGLGLPPSLRRNRGQSPGSTGMFGSWGYSHQHQRPGAVSEESFFSPGDHRISGSASGSGSMSHDPPTRRNTGRSTRGRRETYQTGVTATTAAATDGPPPHLRLQLQRPIVRPVSGLHHEHLGTLYGEIRYWRTQLKALNLEVQEEQRAMYDDIARGINMRGWLLVGRGVRFIPGIRMIEGRSKDDVRWDDLQDESGSIGTIGFWVIVGVVCVVLAGSFVPVLGLFLANAPDFAHFIPALDPITSASSIGSAIVTTLVPSLAAILFTCIALGIVHYSAHLSGAVSNSQTRITAFKATFVVLVAVAGIWMIGLGAVLYSLESFSAGAQETTTVAEGAIYAAAFVLILGLNMAFIAPGLLMLQPTRLLRVTIGQWKALTPRQHFRALYPRAYNPSFGLGACIIAVFLTLTLVLLFPLLGPPLFILVLLSLAAHRYLVGYVYGRTDRGQSGGLLHMWIMRRFATMLALQPFLLGLILLPFREWALACTLIGVALFLVFVVELYTGIRMRQPSASSLSEASRESLDDFSHEMHMKRPEGTGEKALPAPPGGESGGRTPRSRGRTVASMASILDMINQALAIPQASRPHAAVPLPSESINDLVSTARAAATSPDAPPLLQAPDPADEVADLLYPPELLAPDPMIWLTNDIAGVGRAEAADLERYHNLPTVVSLNPAPQPEVED